MSESGAESIVKAVVRGERDWHDLSEADIAVMLLPGGAEIINRGGTMVVAGVEDVATGIVRYAADSDALHDWATVILGGSNFLDLDLEAHPDGDALLDVLWSASHGERPDERGMSIARRLAWPGRSPGGSFDRAPPG
jgi:hypothetical protein